MQQQPKYYQQNLPFSALKCCNPSCGQTAPLNDYFCSQSCYEMVRVEGLRPMSARKSHMKQAAAFLVGIALAAMY